MKIAMTAPRQADVRAWPRPTATALYRLAGLLTAVGVPTLFWTFALVLATKGAGVAIGAPALTAFGLIVAAWSLVGAALAMGSRERSPITERSSARPDQM